MRTFQSIVAAAAALVVLTLAAPAIAHHAFNAEFDANKPVKFKGVVTKMLWVNPHAWIWIDVKGADGNVTNWGIEGGPPTNLLRNGITKTSLPIGTEIKLFGYQAKSGEPKGVGVFVEYLDGRKVFMGGSAPGADGNPTPKKEQ